jgi:hypothetical protein
MKVLLTYDKRAIEMESWPIWLGGVLYGIEKGYRIGKTASKLPSHGDG